MVLGWSKQPPLQHPVSDSDMLQMPTGSVYEKTKSRVSFLPLLPSYSGNLQLRNSLSLT